MGCALGTYRCLRLAIFAGHSLQRPGGVGRNFAIPNDEARYRKRHKIENSFARLKDWRRVATRYDRCPKVFLSACALAAVVMFWL